MYYAGKAFLTLATARWAAEEGLGLDVFTSGERVIGPDARKTAARLYLCASLKQVLANGLALLGVSAPDRM